MTKILSGYSITVEIQYSIVKAGIAEGCNQQKRDAGAKKQKKSAAADKCLPEKQ